MADIPFEEIFFVRIAYEYSKIYIGELSAEFTDYMEKIALTFEDYNSIFNYLL